MGNDVIFNTEESMYGSEDENLIYLRTKKYSISEDGTGKELLGKAVGIYSSNIEFDCIEWDEESSELGSIASYIEDKELDHMYEVLAVLETLHVEEKFRSNNHGKTLLYKFLYALPKRTAVFLTSFPEGDKEADDFKYKILRLKKFYQSWGFEECLDSSIPHLMMKVTK